MSDALAFWAWLLVALPLFWALPPRWRTPFLAAASFAYVLYLDPAVGVAMGAWAALFYALPQALRDRPGLRAQSLLPMVIAILLYLAWYKYLPALWAALGDEGAKKILVPLGLSYFCFKLIHYAIEAQRRGFASRRLDDFLAYVFLFPTFTAGPIERYEHFLQHRSLQWRSEDAIEGTTRIAHGLIKKFVLCEALLLPQLRERDGVIGIIQLLDVLPVHHVWLFFLLSFLYLYLDFSAYSDIAIGASRLFGIRIAENFRWPILATSIVEFWRRWHLSLSGWCQTYVYLPMIGLTRRPVIATYSSFFVIGLWHGASWGWISWALIHASGVVAYGYWGRFKRATGLRMPQGLLGKALGLPATMAFVVLTSVTTALDGKGTPADAVRIAGKMLFGL